LQDGGITLAKFNGNA